MTLLKRQVDELLVYGYTKQEMSVPVEIIDLCFSFYHERDYMVKAGDNCKIEQEGTIVIKDGRGADSCFGSLLITSMSDRDIEYEWKIKVIRASLTCIGLIDASQIDEYVNKDFAGRTDFANYSFFAKGSIFSHSAEVADNNWGDNDAFVNGDVVTMKYNPFKCMLSWTINDDEETTVSIIDKIQKEQGLEYCLAIFMGYSGKSEIKLM